MITNELVNSPANGIRPPAILVSRLASVIGVINAPMMLAPCIPTIQSAWIKNRMTHIPSHELVKFVTNPNGIEIILKMSVPRATRTPLMAKVTIVITKAGIRAVNERATPGGTASGILITRFFLTQKT